MGATASSAEVSALVADCGKAYQPYAAWVVDNGICGTTLLAFDHIEELLDDACVGKEYHREKLRVQHAASRARLVGPAGGTASSAAATDARDGVQGGRLATGSPARLPRRLATGSPGTGVGRSPRWGEAKHSTATSRTPPRTPPGDGHSRLRSRHSQGSPREAKLQGSPREAKARPRLPRGGASSPREHKLAAPLQRRVPAPPSLSHPARRCRSAIVERQAAMPPATGRRGHLSATEGKSSRLSRGDVQGAGQP